jgi:tryptophan 2,3-dioxygenase
MAELKLSRRKPLTYGGYLNLDIMLGLQKPLSRPVQHDELLFIVSHQTYELWFKTILNELDAAVASMNAGDPREAARLVRRVVAIEKVLTQQLEVLETIRPTDFLKFRDALRPASGFQSWQFREIEFLSGQKDPRYLELHLDEKQIAARLKTRLDSPSLWDAFLVLLKRRGLKVNNEGGLKAVVEVYQNPRYGDLAELAEAFLEYDKNFWLWRNHHMGMVERIIGRKVGTGAEAVQDTLHRYSFDSSGVTYLKTTLRRRFFPALWAARTKLAEGPT